MEKYGGGRNFRPIWENRPYLPQIFSPVEDGKKYAYLIHYKLYTRLLN